MGETKGTGPPGPPRPPPNKNTNRSLFFQPIKRKRRPRSPLAIQAAQATQAANYQALVNQAAAPASAQIIQSVWRGKKGKGKTRRKKRRKKGGFSTQDVIINNRNKENNLCNRFNTPVNLLNEESFKQPKLKKTIMLSKILKEGKCTSLLNKFSKKANKAMVNSTKAGRRTRRKRRRKTKRKRRRKTKRKKRRRKKRKTRRSKTRRTRRKKQHGGSVELENWRPTASYGLNDAGDFSKKIPTDSYPNFTTNPARY